MRTMWYVKLKNWLGKESLDQFFGNFRVSRFFCQNSRFLECLFEDSNSWGWQVCQLKSSWLSPFKFYCGSLYIIFILISRGYQLNFSIIKSIEVNRIQSNDWNSTISPNRTSISNFYIFLLIDSIDLIYSIEFDSCFSLFLL